MTGHVHIRRRTAAFTLIELLAVIMIIGILMSMILGIATWANRANMEAKARADIETMRTAIENFKMDMGDYPGLDTWTNDLSSAVPPGFEFMDPWHRPYHYWIESEDSTTYRLYSVGADGAEAATPGGPEDADNIEAGRF